MIKIKKTFLFRITVFVVLSMLVTYTIAFATRYFDVDLEGASISGNTLTDSGINYNLAKQDQGGYPTLSSSIKYQGSYSLKCYLPANNNSTIDRTEAQIATVNFSSGTRFYGFRIYVPTDFTASSDTSDAGYNIFTQLWQYSPAMPIVTLEVKRNSNLQYDLVIRNDDTGPIWDTAAITWPIRYSDTLDKGVWTNFILKVTPNPNGTGEVKLYKNDTLKYTYTGKVGYSTKYTSTQSSRWSVGMYTGNSNHPNARTLYFDNIRLANTYDDAWPN